MTVESPGEVLAALPQGDYTVDSLAKELISSLKENNHDATLKVETYNPKIAQKFQSNCS